MKGVLTDVKVLDFSTLLPGPMATLFLADAGACVIKVERPGKGDDMRHYSPRWGDTGVNFAMLNRGKKSIAIDLKNPAQRARLAPLIAESDVIVEQFRPGVMDRLDLGYDAMSKIKPDIIYCAITGYGQDGPKRDVAGHDLNYVGDAGLLSLGYGDPSQPVVPPGLIADLAGGAYPAVMNILLALRHRDVSGEGTFIDVSMTESLFPFTYWAMGQGAVTGRWPGNGDGIVTGGSPRYQLYPTSDGKLLAAAPLEDKFWQRFTEMIDLPDALCGEAADPRAVIAAVAERIAARPASYWASKFAAADCCCSIVNSMRQAMDDPQFTARDVFARKLRGGSGETINALPTPISPTLRKQDADATGAPALGADNGLLDRSA